MPEISRFFGIIISMFFDDHPQPHFHAFYAGQDVEVTIETRTIVNGRISPRALALVAEWATIHVDELRADWELARARQPLSKIAPLR